ncbi:hypothetical protein ACHHYP_00747 [Achlya hypogyna]|uniref:Uncharacterized protein n=1 Tax=Achlya hypogyna TaxID=1202772 RepID=A0A1V9ZTW8_ACHHY|nr:hypothetical protein ACHHYP_00747 [Achlya hypogyna]
MQTCAPVVVTFAAERTRAMLVGDASARNVACIEARFQLGPQELIEFRAVHAPTEPTTLFAESLVYVMAERRYLQARRWRRRLEWSDKPTERAMFVVRPTELSTGPLRLAADFQLQSYRSPRWFVAFRAARPSEIWSLGTLVLEASAAPLKLRAELPKARVCAPQRRLPTVFVSLESCHRQLQRRSRLPPVIPEASEASDASDSGTPEP